MQHLTTIIGTFLEYDNNVMHSRSFHHAQWPPKRTASEIAKKRTTAIGRDSRRKTGDMCNELYALTDSVFTSILLLFNNLQTKSEMHYVQRLCFVRFNEKPQSHHHPKPNIGPIANVKCEEGRKIKKIITFIATRKWNDTLVRYVFNKTCCIIHFVYSL